MAGKLGLGMITCGQPRQGPPWQVGLGLAHLGSDGAVRQAGDGDARFTLGVGVRLGTVGQACIGPDRRGSLWSLLAGYGRQDVAIRARLVGASCGRHGAVAPACLGGPGYGIGLAGPLCRGVGGVFALGKAGCCKAGKAWPVSSELGSARHGYSRHGRQVLECGAGTAWYGQSWQAGLGSASSGSARLRVSGHRWLRQGRLGLT